MRHLLYIGCFLLQAYPALATIVVFGHHQGLSGQSTSQPGDKIQVYEVRLVNDGTSSLQAIALTLSDLSSATGITASAITQLSVYKSTDAVFDAPSDSLLGTQTIVNIGAPTTVSLTAPLTWSSDFPYFLVVATFNSTHTDELSGFKDAFRVGSNAGAIQTSSGNVGSAITADDADRHTIDILATQIVFTTLPSDPAAANGDIVSGQVFTTQPVVEARDANGNVDIDATGSATISVQSGDVSLSGTTAQSWSNGRATFSNLAAIATADATVFALRANASGLSSATSPSLQSDVVASQIVFTQEAAHSGLSNGDVLSGVVFQTQPIVQGQDQNGARDLHFQDQVTLTTATGTLAGTTTVQAQNGIATFSDIAYTATADQESFRLVADDQATGSGGDLVAKTANARTADIVATQIVFTTLPSDPAATNGNIVSSQVFTTQPVVEAQNAAGQRDLNFTGTANLELPPGNPTLSGTISETWISGRADFAGNGLRITATADATTFALQAQSGSLSGQSTTLTADIVATQIAFTTLPSDPAAINGDIVNGQVFAVQPVIQARDDNDVNDIHYQGNLVTISVQSGSVSLSGTSAQSWDNGRATFSELATTGTADGETFILQAQNGSLPQVLTRSLQSDVVASQMVFTQEAAHSGLSNGDVLSGVVFQTQPIVQGQDQSGARDLHFQDQVSLTAATGTLAGTTTIQAQNGIATFSDIAYTATDDQESFRLVADDQATGSGGDLVAKTANTLTADILATQIVFTILPSDPAAANGDIVSGQVFTTQPVVEARDANGNVDIDATGSATISVQSGDVSLSGTTAQSWSNGRATFSNLAAIATADATVFTLQANASGLSSATSPSLQSDIVASQIVFTQEAAHSGLSNGDVLSGVVFQTQPIVQGQDQNGARDLHFQDQVTLTTATGTLTGTTTVQAQNGIATFSDIAYTATADQESFWLVADDQATGSGGDLVAKTANARTADIVATQIVFTTLPSDPAATNGDIVSGQVFTTQPVVEAQNAAGQRDLNFTGTANLELAAGSISLSGTTGIAFNTGRADFGQSEFKAQATTDGASFALKAQATGLPDRDSATLTADIVATRIAFATAPSADGGGIVNDQIFTTQPVVEARDGDGQRDIHSNDIQVILGITSGNAVLSGATGQALQNGLASFSGLSATGTSGLFQISASALGLFADTLSVTLHAGPVAAIELSASAPSIQLGETDNVELSALLSDANGNLAERGDNQVLFTLVGPGSFASGLSAVDADSGIARTLVTAAEAGTLYVEASVGGAVGTLSIPVVSAQPPYLDLNTSLQSIPADGSIATQLTVSLRDSRGQLLSEDDTTSVRFSLTGGHGLLTDDEVIARGGLVSVSLRGLGIAGPLTVRAEANGLEAAEIVLRANPAAPYRIDLVALPPTIVADRNSTTVLSAVVRDSLGNIVVDANLEIHFNISGDLAEITGPQTAMTEDGNARTILRSSIRAGEVEITATVPGLVTGQTRLNLTAGPAVKIQLRATPTALPADIISTSQLTAEVLDVHGNQVADDSTTAISFSVSGGPGEILAPVFSLTHAGQANALLQSTGPPGKILVFAGASGLASATFEIRVRQAQVPHFTDELPTLNLVEDGPAVRLDLSALTNDGDSNLEDLRFAVTADSAQVRLEIEGYELVATPVIRDYWGHLTATLTVRDPTGLESSALLPVTVQPQNDPPQFVSVPDSLVSADSLFIYQLSATDADGDPLTFTLIERPQGMAFDRALRRAVWRTPAPGVHSVTFAVSDGTITTLQHVQIRVAVNDTQLRFTSEPVTRTRRGQLYTYQPEIDDAGNRPLAYSLVAGPRRMHIDKQTGMITWISTDADTTLLDVTLQVSDGTRQQTQRFQIRLVEGNTPPIILSAPVEVAWIDSLYIYSLRATDTDDNTLAYNIVEGPADMRINPLSGLLAWVPEEADLGVHEITLNAYDGQETTVQRYQLQVRRPGNPPRIGPLKGLAFTPGAELVAQLELDPLVTDPDHNDQDLLWSFAHLSGDLVSIDYDPIAQTVRFSATARFNAARIRLTVSDPDGHTAEHILRLGLREEGDFNGDATIDLDDFFRFVDAFGTDIDAPTWDGTADLNDDGQIDFDDFFVFIERFEENNARPGN